MADGRMIYSVLLFLPLAWNHSFSMVLRKSGSRPEAGRAELSISFVHLPLVLSILRSALPASGLEPLFLKTIAPIDAIPPPTGLDSIPIRWRCTLVYPPRPGPATAT